MIKLCRAKIYLSLKLWFLPYYIHKQMMPRNINETIIWYIHVYVWYTLILPIQFETVLLHCYMYVTMNLPQLDWRTAVRHRMLILQSIFSTYTCNFKSISNANIQTHVYPNDTSPKSIVLWTHWHIHVQYTLPSSMLKWCFSYSNQLFTHLRENICNYAI